MLIPTPDTHRIPHNIYMCTPSPIAVVSRRLEFSVLLHIPLVPLSWYHPHGSCLLSFTSSSLTSCFACHWGGFHPDVLECVWWRQSSWSHGRYYLPFLMTCSHPARTITVYLILTTNTRSDADVFVAHLNTYMTAGLGPW